MRDFESRLNKYKSQINRGIAIRAILGTLVLFVCAVHLWFLLWQTLTAYSPALLYANLALRTALALSIISLLWQAYRNFFDLNGVARYLDGLSDEKDDLYQNSYEIYTRDGDTPVSQALAHSAADRINKRDYQIPKPIGTHQALVIGFLLAGILFYWTYLWPDFGYAFRQFYTNKAPAINYKSDITLSPGSIRIGKNQPVMIRVIDPDPRLEHRLYYRYSESWRELGLSQNSYIFNRLENSIEYYVENEVAKSPIYKISVLDEPIVREWQVSYQYPAYTGLSAFSDSLSYGDIEAYAGTVVSLGIKANIPIVRATMIFEDASRKELTKRAPAEYITQFKLNRASTWYLEMEDELGRLSRPEEKQIRILPDNPPQIRIVFPGQDISLNQDLMLPLIISADDDFGLANCSLYYQINSDPAHNVTVQSVIRSKLFNTDYVWDMKDLDLFPGDVVTYWAEVFDNAPAPQKASSSKFRARFPSIEEIYAEIEQNEKQKQDELSSSLQESEKLQERFEEKRREMLKDPNLKWEDKQELQDILQKQEDLSQQVENIAENYRDLINKMQANSTLSQDTLQKMMKIQELMQEIATDEMMQAMRKMEEAMQNVSAEALKKAMEDFKFSMEDFAKKIEQTLDLLESIKNEQAVQKALQISEEMEKMQKALHDKTMDSAQNPDKLAEDQQQIQDKYDTLNEELEKLKDMLAKDPDAKKQLDDLLKDIQQSDAKQDMQNSQQSLQQNKRSQAQQSQSAAMEKMRRFSLKLAQMKESMSSGAQAAIVQAIELSIRELLIFSKQHEATKARYENNPYPIVPDLISAYEGVQISLNKLFSQPQVSMMIPPKFFIDLTDTNKAYRDIFSTLGQTYTPNIRAHLDNVQKGLNLMVYDLMQALQNSSSGGGGGGMQSMMQMLEQMGQEQMAMNMLTEQLMMQMQAQGGRMDSATRDQVGKLASDQERLAENLKRALQNNPEAQKQGNAIKQIIDEAEAVARQLKQNQFSPELMKRQENILSRLLDAQRSINKRDTSERRQAEQASGLPMSPSGKGIDYESLRKATLLEDGFKSYPREYQQLIMEYLKLLQEGGR